MACTILQGKPQVLGRENPIANTIIQRSAKVLVHGLVKFFPALAWLAGTNFTKPRTKTLADICSGVPIHAPAVANRCGAAFHKSHRTSCFNLTVFLAGEGDIPASDTTTGSFPLFFCFPSGTYIHDSVEIPLHTLVHTYVVLRSRIDGAEYLLRAR